MIKIENYDKEKQAINFVTDMSVNLANAIRRSVLEIPVMAVDEIEVVKNDSALFDEILANRIGLIPIKTDKITDKGQKFKLKKSGPCTVCSGDFSPSMGTEYKLPIVILDDGQEIELVANAKSGIGNEHIKYSPGLVYYKHNLSEEFLDLINIEDGKIIYDEKELKENGFSEEQITNLKKIDKVDGLNFYIESWGQIEVKSIFAKAIDALNKNLNELSKVVK